MSIDDDTVRADDEVPVLDLTEDELRYVVGGLDRSWPTEDSPLFTRIAAIARDMRHADPTEG